MMECAYAAAEGNLELLKSLRSEGKPWDELVCNWASNEGRYETLKWALENGAPWTKFNFLEAAGRGRVDIMELAVSTKQWDNQKRFEPDRWACAYAAGAGQIQALKWLRDNRNVFDPFDTMTCAYAAAQGQLDTLKWLRSEDEQKRRKEDLVWCNRSTIAPWDETACMFAAQNGHLETLKWLRSEGAPWSKYVYQRAASSGQLHVLKWLYELCPPEGSFSSKEWPSNILLGAVRNGHLETVKWLMDTFELTPCESLLYPALRGDKPIPSHVGTNCYGGIKSTDFNVLSKLCPSDVEEHAILSCQKEIVLYLLDRMEKWVERVRAESKTESLEQYRNRKPDAGLPSFRPIFRLG